MGTSSRTCSGVVQRKAPVPEIPETEPEDATTETRRMFGASILASTRQGSFVGGSKNSSEHSLPPASESGQRVLFTSPTQAMAEMRVIKAQFAALKKLAYKIQNMEPTQLSAEWDAIRKAGNEQYADIERSISRFLRHTNGAPRWQPRFYTYYLLPILLNILKLAIFCSPAGIIGVLVYDVLVVATFTVLRHPYAVSVAVSYAADHDAIPSMAKTACLYLTYEAVKSVGRDYGVTAIDTWDAFRVDLRPLYSVALCIYLVYAVAHQAYTLYLEDSWKHRRWLDVLLSVVSHQVNNISFVVAFCESACVAAPPCRSSCRRFSARSLLSRSRTDRCYERESAPYLLYVARQCYAFMHAGPTIQPNFYTSHRVQHFKDLYPFVHKYHHMGHPTTPWEAQEGGLMEFWAGHTAFLMAARTGVSKRPTPIGHILGMLRCGQHAFGDIFCMRVGQF